MTMSSLDELDDDYLTFFVLDGVKCSTKGDTLWHLEEDPFGTLHRHPNLDELLRMDPLKRHTKCVGPLTDSQGVIYV